MEIAEVSLKNYRSYRDLTLRPDGHLNILVGPNAAGKTNLLESIHYLATGRSHRTHRDAELIRWGAEWFSAAVTVRVGQVRRRIECTYAHERGKEFKLDGIRQTRMGDALGVLNAVIFSPDDLYLIKGGPEERRSLMDAEIGQISPRYRRALTRYGRILAQRNDTLKKVAAARYSAATAELMCEPWEEQLADVGGAVVAVRLVMVRRWAAWAKRMYRKVVDSGEALEVVYRPSFADPSEVGEASMSELRQWARERLLQRLQESRGREIERGYTTVGPQRDDLKVMVDGRDARQYASQGQQRSAVLALRIAEIGWMEEETGRKPVLLLDDVMSELDTSRAQRLAERVGRQGQTFITCTDLSEVDADGSATVWKVRDGEVLGPVG